MTATAETKTSEREVVDSGTASRRSNWLGWTIGASIGVGLVALGVALWAGWQPVAESGAVEPGAAGITFSNVQVREAPAVLGGTPGGITYSTVQARDATAGLGATPAHITYSNVQARESAAGLGGKRAQITFSDVQVREAP